MLKIALKLVYLIVPLFLLVPTLLEQWLHQSSRYQTRSSSFPTSSDEHPSYESSDLSKSESSESSQDENSSFIDNFQEAKRAAVIVYRGYETTIYCNCPYQKNLVDIAACGYQPRKDVKRAHRLEWEHIVPAYTFGKTFREWTTGDPACENSETGKKFRGRKCAAKVSEVFRKMEGELYNLAPAVGEVNAIRSNLPFGLVDSGDEKFNICGLRFSETAVEPPREIRGFIARTYLHMDAKFPNREIIPNAQTKQMYLRWHKEFPQSDWEVLRAKRMMKLTGEPHRFISL